jgi:regulator of protease activity HflC (stomatin/prohibitin superfamily)
MLLYRLVDPVRVAYETFDLSHATEKLVQTTLRSIIGDMGLDDTLASREEIERSLTTKIAAVCYNWGLEIKSVELLEITPTDTVQAAMHQQLAAERIRRAAIVSAEGYREKVRLEAEGEAQSTIARATGDKQVTTIRAQGQADARRLIARAEADAVRVIAGALQEYGVDPTAYMVGLKYIDSMTALASNASSREIYFPLETDVSGALGATMGKGSAGVAAAAAAASVARAGGSGGAAGR